MIVIFLAKHYYFYCTSVAYMYTSFLIVSIYELQVN